MLGIGGSEFLLILVVAVLVLGPEHLPRIMRTVTKVTSDVRRVSTDFQRAMNLEAHKQDWERENTAASTQKPRRKKKKTPSASDVDETPPQTASDETPPQTASAETTAPAEPVAEKPAAAANSTAETVTEGAGAKTSETAAAMPAAGAPSEAAAAPEPELSAEPHTPAKPDAAPKGDHA